MSGNIIGIMLRNVEQLGDKPALIEGDRAIGYRELLDDARRIAGYLHEQGIGRGSRVLLFVPMSAELYRLLLALFHLGAVAVFIDAWAGRRRITDACRVARPDAFIGIPKSHLLRLLSSEIRRIPLKLMARSEQWNPQHAVALPPAEVDPSTAALITFTTGSTGVPRGALRSHRFLVAQHEAIVRSFAPSVESVDMPVLPIFVLSNLALGSTTLLPPVDPRSVASFDPAEVVRQMANHRVNSSTGSPAFFERLATYCIEGGIVLQDLRELHVGGGAIFPSLARRMVQAFPMATITIVYGSTEAEPISLIDARELLRRGQSNIGEGLPVGLPVSFIRVAIVPITADAINAQDAESFSALQLPTGEVGEICVAGEHVLKEYHGSDDALRRNKIPVAGELWHRTGDAGYLDGEGMLYLVGRARQSFLHRGRRVFVFPIEERLQEIDGVAVGTILQVGEQSVVVVELTHRHALDSGFHLELEARDIPFDRIRVVKRIPRDPRHNSKIDYDRLRSMIEDE